MKQNNFLGKKILVTGGAGFIGSHVVDKLLEKGNKVVVIDNLSTGLKGNLNPQAKLYRIDIGSPGVSRIFEKEKPDVVFHFAAQINVRKSLEDPKEDAKTNILGSLNILDNCRGYKVKKIIFSSTGGAMYGDADIIPTPETYLEKPASPYGIAKLTVEKYLYYYERAFGIPFAVLRFANVYGPRQNSRGEAGVIAIFCDKMLSDNKPVIYDSGKQTRDFIFIDDIVRANLMAFEKNKTGIFNIGTGEETDINTIFKKLKKLNNSNCREIHEVSKLTEPKRSCLDSCKARKELGWQPEYSLDKGLEETVKWFKKNSLR